MPDSLEYIESYFQQTVTKEEKSTFEKRCETDESFAKEVAFYIATRSLLREELLAQKQQQWREDVVAEEAPVISLSKKSTLLRWVTYAAAACLILIVSMFLFETQTSTKRLADNYIKTYKPEVTMDASHDSLQLGVSAYKDENYTKALGFFKGVAKRDSVNTDAKIYTGLTYIQLKNYDEALQQFDELANIKGLYYNPGDFLKAVTLLERNKDGDKETAKTLLTKVVNEKESEKEKASEWLKKF